MASKMMIGLSNSDMNLMTRKGFRVEKLLGEGAYAKVFAVLAVRKNTRLACKYMNQSLVPQDFVTKFLPRELKILLKIHHPNIVHIHSIWLNNNKCFVFMRLVENGDALGYLINGGELNENHAKFWFHQMAEALRYLHTMDIVHRDIKLENIFVSNNMNVKLGDFGFARNLSSANGENQMSETFCGSQQYAAPEVIKGRTYNPKLADVWSLGCVLFAMLNKKLPFDTRDVARLYELQISHRYKYKENVLERTSSEAKTLIYHMLEPLTIQRYSIEDVVKSEWLKEIQPTEEEKQALEIARNEKKLKKRSIDIPVCSARGELKQQIVLKEESMEHFVSSKLLPDAEEQVPVKAEPIKPEVKPEARPEARPDAKPPAPSESHRSHAGERKNIRQSAVKIIRK